MSQMSDGHAGEGEGSREQGAGNFTNPSLCTKSSPCSSLRSEAKLSLGGQTQQTAGELKIHKALRHRDRHLFALRYRDDCSHETREIGLDLARQKQIDVVRGNDPTLLRFCDLDHWH